MSKTITLTDAEEEVLDNYIFRKLCKLKESGLEDSRCYEALMSIHSKLKHIDSTHKRK